MKKANKDETAPDVGEEKGLPKMWRVYDVELTIKHRIYGGLPKDPSILEGFLKGKGVKGDLQPLVEQIAGEIDTDVPDDAAVEKAWTCFKKDDTGIFIETRQVKALLKEVTSASELWKRYKGLKSRIGDNVFPVGEGGPDNTRIYLMRDGRYLQEPDGHEQSPARISGPQGARSIIKIKDYADAPTISFRLKVGGKLVSKDILEWLFEYGTEIGLGADRSCEHGKYRVEKFKEVKNP